MKLSGGPQLRGADLPGDPARLPRATRPTARGRSAAPRPGRARIWRARTSSSPSRAPPAPGSTSSSPTTSCRRRSASTFRACCSSSDTTRALKALPGRRPVRLRAELAQPRRRRGSRSGTQEYPAPSDSARRPARLRLLRARLRREPQHQRLLRPPDGAAPDAARRRPRPRRARRPPSGCGGEVDRRVIDLAVWLPLFNPKRIDLVSRRVGNYRWSPQLHLMPSRRVGELGDGVSDAARGAGRRVELTGLRRGTVRSMSVSAVVPQFTLQRDVPTDGPARGAEALKSGDGTATLTDVITMACARALREHPGVNSSYDDDCVIEHERVNIGLALALDDGLTVPVILDADARSLEGLAAERLRLAEAARTRVAARRGDLRRHVQHLEPRAARRRPLPGAGAAAAGSDPGRRLAARDRQPLGVLRPPRRRRRTRRALPRDDRAAAGRARVGARGAEVLDGADQPRRARSGGATRGRSSAGRGRSRWPLAALSPASQAAT